MTNISSSTQPPSSYDWDDATLPLLHKKEASSAPDPATGAGAAGSIIEPASSETTPNRLHADRARLLQALTGESVAAGTHAGPSPEIEVDGARPPASPTSNKEGSGSNTSHEWPVLTCTLMISPHTGDVAWAGADADRQSARRQDAAALGGLFAELNSSMAFKETMKGIAAKLPEGQRFEIAYKMGASMDQLYNNFRSRYTVEKAHLWKDADHAAQRRLAAAADVGAPQDDYVEHELHGMSVMSAALCGIARQGSAWDEKTGGSDYASMTEVTADIAISVAFDQRDAGAGQPATEATRSAHEIQAAMAEELRQPGHAAFRASQANSHARYQAGKIELNWGALAGSMIGGGVYSLGTMVLNNQINRNMIPEYLQKELGLDLQSALQKAFSDVSDVLLQVATPREKILMTVIPSALLAGWEIFDNALLDWVLGKNKEEQADGQASTHADASSIASGDGTGQRSWAAALWKAQEKTRAALSELSLQKVRSGLTSAALGASEMAGQMVSSAGFAVPAGIVSGVFSAPDKAIETWKPGRSGAPFKAGFKLAVTSPMSSLACSSGFFLKMGEVAAETEAAVLQALEDKQLAWPQHNPFDAAQAFDRGDLEQVKRAVWDMTQDQLNNEPDALAVRLSVPMEFLSGVMQGGISLIPGMNQAISFALDTLFFGPGELLWMTITGVVSNRTNERELRAKLAEVQQQCSENNATPKEVRRVILRYLLENKLISEDALEQWRQQTVSMLGGAMIHQVYERSADLKNAGRIGMRTMLVDLPRKIDAALPEPVRALTVETGRLADETGKQIGTYAGKAVDAVAAASVNAIQSSVQYIRGDTYVRDEQAAERYAEALKALPQNAAAAIANMLTPGENNLRIRARLPYERVLALR